MSVDLIEVGRGTVRLLLRRWMQLPVDTSRDGAPTIRYFSEGLPQRVFDRQLGELSDEIALRIADRFRIGLANLEANDATQLSDAISGLLDDSALPDSAWRGELDPTQLEKALVAAAPADPFWALTDAGRTVAELVLREACDYVIELSTGLAPPDSAVSHTAMSTKDALVAQAAEVLDQIPAALDSGVVGATPAEAFEERYRRAVYHNMDTLELFGVSAEPSSRRYNLSIAYLSLAVSQHESRTARRLPGHGRSTYVRVEEALASGTRHLIRGQAGSGKTTLLQWLATRSSGRSFDEPLLEWNASVPFFIALRKFAKEPLPDPTAFVRHVTPLLADEEPRSWAAQKLGAGAGLVLIDGLDELSRDRREGVRAWLRELMTLFPTCRYVVTTRESAVEDGWLDAESFDESDLHPMTGEDVRSFVAHWHRAALRRATSEAEKAELVNLEARLVGDITTHSHLASLATSPLLCAMLCALNRDRESDLPDYRTDLYRLALDTLISRRDSARRVPANLSGIQSPEKHQLLQALASWLVEMDQPFIDREEALEQISIRVRSLRTVTAEPDELLDELLVRSGVIREPVVGQFDFVHKTFLEYFAAAEAVERSHYPRLLRYVSDSRWYQVLLLAAGLAPPRKRDQLIIRLLDSAEETVGETRRQHALAAIECQAESPLLGETVSGRIVKAIRSLVPPRNGEDARRLAGAGDLVVPELSAFTTAEPSVASACIYTLGHIASPGALRALEAFGPDSRPEVVQALVEVWGRFDLDEFASRVLATSPLFDGVIRIHDPALLPPTKRLSALRAVECSFTAAVSEPRVFTQTTKLARVSTTDARGITGVGCLGDQPLLQSGEFSQSTGWIEWSGGAAPKLEDLTLRDAVNLPNLTGIGGSLPGLRRLSIGSAHKLASLSGAEDLDDLEQLYVSDCIVRDLSPLSHLGRLRRLAVTRFLPRVVVRMEDARAPARPRSDIDLAAIHSLEGIEHLDLRGCAGLSGIETLERLTALEWLRLDGCRGLSHLDWAAELEKLEVLSVRDCRGISDISPLSQCSSLRLLDVSRTETRALPVDWGHLENLSTLMLGGTAIRDLTPLERLPSLRRLSVVDLPLPSARVLASLTGLEELDIAGARDADSLEFVRDLPHLRTLRVSPVALRDIEPLLYAPELEELQVSGELSASQAERLADHGILVSRDSNLWSKRWLTPGYE